MPATRTASIPPRSRHFLTPSPPKNLPNATRTAGVLTLSEADSSTDSIVPTHLKNKPKAQPRPKKVPFVPHTNEVIEISSDDEDLPPVASTSEVADLRRDISRLRGESMKHKRNFERASKELNEVKEENRQLQILCKPDKAKLMLDANQLSDQLDCEICTSRMWTPYALPDCGHTFCQSCLQDWFSTAQAQFLATHPENNLLQAQNVARLKHILLTISQHPQLVQDPHIVNLINPLIPPQPTYTCPTCREPVRSRPTEVFGLKAIVRTLAAATGEKSPQRKAVAGRKGKAPAPVAGPWDGFFPPKRTP